MGLEKQFNFKEGVGFGIYSTNGRTIRMEDPGIKVVKIFHKGVVVGSANLSWDRESNIIQVYLFTVLPEYRANKFGSNLIEAVNSIIRSKGALGKLRNAADFALYGNHGWEYERNEDGEVDNVNMVYDGRH